MEVFVRRACGPDVPAIEDLVGSDALLLRKRFGEFSFSSLIECCYISVVAAHEDETCAGFASFSEFPSNSSLPRTSWPKWLEEKTGDKPNPLSTIWLEFFFAEASYEKEVIDEILRSVFSTHPSIDRVFFVLREGITTLFDPLNLMFSKLFPLEDDPYSELSIYVLERHIVMPTLDIRKGFVEDHDDLLGLVEGQGERLVSLYGDYYLAEILEEQDDTKRALVAEVQGEAVGLMRLCSDDFDPKVLAECFELGPYDNLVKTVDGKEVCNAFHVQLFCMSEDYEARAIDFLQPAFDIFPDKDYCILLLPHNTTDFELLNVFTHVPLKPWNTYGHALFVFNVHSLRTDVVIRKTLEDDMPLIHEMVTGLEEEKFMIDAFSSLDSEKESFVMTCEGQVVGATVVNSKVDLKHIRAHFSMDAFIKYEEYQDEEHALLSEFVVNPIFLNRSRFFLRETLRLSGKSILYHEGMFDKPLSAVVEQLTPVPPRRAIETLGNEKGEDKSEYSLFFTSRRLLSERKVDIHARIVVVGASDTGLSVIYNLLRVPDANFTNITLISPDGLPSLTVDEMDVTYKPETHVFLPSEYHRLLVDPSLNIIESKLVDFYRDTQTVLLEDQSLVPYDYLVLATGQLYKVSRRVHPKNEKIPLGVFCPKDKRSQDEITNNMKRYIKSHEKPVVVYGSNIDAYCAVESLVAIGVKPSDIVFATPKNRWDHYLQTGEFAEKTNETTRQCGIVHLPFHSLKSLVKEEGSNRLGGVILQKDLEGDVDDVTKAIKGKHVEEEPFEQPCEMLIYCHGTEVDDDILHAVNERALVFDGRLILKPNFKTEDPKVMAVGSVAKFSRRYGPAEPFELFHPREVATKFTNVLLPELAPSEFVESSDEMVFPPVFTKARAFTALLPSELFLFRAWQPAAELKRIEMMSADADIGSSAHYKYRSTDVNGNFVCVVTDNLGIVTEIQYLGEEPPFVFNFLSLIGMNVTYLNNLGGRFDEGVIDDLHTFLSENWTSAVYHDRFTLLRESLLEELRDDNDIQSIESQIREFLRDRRPLCVTADEFHIILDNISPEVKKKVEKMVIEFLHDNSDVLTAYFLPSLKSSE